MKIKDQNFSDWNTKKLDSYDTLNNFYVDDGNYRNYSVHHELLQFSVSHLSETAQ